MFTFHLFVWNIQKITLMSAGRHSACNIKKTENVKQNPWLLCFCYIDMCVCVCVSGFSVHWRRRRLNLTRFAVDLSLIEGDSLDAYRFLLYITMAIRLMAESGSPQRPRGGLIWGQRADIHCGQAKEVRVRERPWWEWWWQGVNLQSQLPWQ